MMVDTEKVKGKAEEIRGKVEQAVGKATGSKKTQARGMVEEAKGRARGKVADVKDGVKKMLRSEVTRLNFISVAVPIVGAVIMMGLFRALAPSGRHTR